MKQLLILFLVFTSLFCYAQENDDLNIESAKKPKSLREAPKENPKASIDKYRIVTLERDTTYVDTSLTIRKEYSYNTLRRDLFGLLPFANDGQTYNTLNFGLKQNSIYPEFGFKAKHFNYLTAKNINYYSVATPLTELYFKTVSEQGQSVDAFITLNTSERLNFSIGYKGLRSLGKYINSLSSIGNFTFTTTYTTKNKRYSGNYHYTNQDILNYENGGLKALDNFESGNSQFIDRLRLDVKIDDASSLLEGKRYFINHSFNLNPKNTTNNILIEHQFSYESKFFNFKTAKGTTIFGTPYSNSNINDSTNSTFLFNRLGATFSNSKIGNFNFFIENYQYNYYYNKIIIANNQVIVENAIKNKFNSIGGKYFYKKNKINAVGLLQTSISKQAFSTLELNAQYQLNEKNNFEVQYLNQSKVPDLNYTLYQSSFVKFNWQNSFNNEKINTLKIKANTQWGNAEAQITLLNDHLYFSNDTLVPKYYTTPKQYKNTINYLSLKANKELHYGKFSFDNTLLFQQVGQADNILNLPKITTRNTIYYTDYFFKKALYLQTGITLNYFTKYNANDYNPLIAEFFVQNQKQIGGYPLLDYFVNARIRQTRIFLKAEHFNSGLTGRNYLSAPSYPYSDFIIRFGLVWNFFQ